MAIEEFANTSLQGIYAVAGAGWGGRASMASIGTIRFDGKGHASGLMRQSVPGETFGERQLIEFPFEGSYQVNADGSGTTLSMGGKFETRLAITRTEIVDGSRAAQEFSLMAKDLEPSTGSLNLATATRLPDTGKFSNASLKGAYVGVTIGRGGQTAGAGFGLIRYDGNGHFSEHNIANVQGDSFRERRFVMGTDAGNYTVNADGTGFVADGGVVFVITRAEIVDGIKIAHEYAFIVRELIPTTGNLFTGVTRRLSD